MAEPKFLNEEQAAVQLAALGNKTRLQVFKLLVRAGHHGLNVGAVQHHLKKPASTLAHHLSALSRSGLVSQVQHGREVRCRVDFEVMIRLVGYLTEQCCTGVISDPARPLEGPE